MEKVKPTPHSLMEGRDIRPRTKAQGYHTFRAWHYRWTRPFGPYRRTACERCGGRGQVARTRGWCVNTSGLAVVHGSTTTDGAAPKWDLGVGGSEAIGEVYREWKNSRKLGDGCWEKWRRRQHRRRNKQRAWRRTLGWGLQWRVRTAGTRAWAVRLAALTHLNGTWNAHEQKRKRPCT
jgi:hypothetical protein